MQKNASHAAGLHRASLRKLHDLDAALELMYYGWRGMTADSLALQIEDDIRRGGFAAARVVERRAAEATSDVALALTLVAAPARMLTTLSNDERISWLIWVSLITAATWWIRRNRARRAI